MKIAVITEDSQIDRNPVIVDHLTKVAHRYGHEVVNLGMFTEEDKRQLNFTQTGLVASVVIELGIADYVVTGCGTGQGAMLSCNSYQNLVCGFVKQPLDAYLFSQVNAGNVVSLPLAQNYGWGSEINLDYIFEVLFSQPAGQGYPAVYAEGQGKSRIRMDKMKKAVQKAPLEAIQSLDKNFVISALEDSVIIEQLRAANKSLELREYLLNLLNEGEN